MALQGGLVSKVVKPPVAAQTMIEKLIILAILVAAKRLLAQLERLLEKLETLF